MRHYGLHRESRFLIDGEEDGGPFAGTIVMTSRRHDGAPADLPASDRGEAAPLHPRSVRYSDRPLDWRSRLFGMTGTMLIGLLAIGCVLFAWKTVSTVVPSSAPLVVDLLPLAAPPEPVQEVPEGPQQVERKEQKLKEQDRPEPPEIVIPRPSPITIAIEPPTEQMEAADPVPETTAPKALPVPPSRRASSDAKATWEALLLAHLEKYRRYPASARARREQGVAHVRFRMNRAGALLSAAIVRSSGSAALDRAALDTLRRAQPLPAIPDDRPATLELSVPVEFFVR